MLEQLLIFTRGGLLLWTWQELANSLKRSLVNVLIRSWLLEERAGDSCFQYADATAAAAYTLKWRFHNQLGLVFVAVYQKLLHLLYVDELLENVMREFCLVYSPRQTNFPDFDDTFRQLLKEAEANSKRKGVAQRNPRKGLEGKRHVMRFEGKGVKSAGKESNEKTSSGGDDEADGEADSKGKTFRNGDGGKNANGSHLSGSSSYNDDNDSLMSRNSHETAFDVSRLQLRNSKGHGKKGTTPLDAQNSPSKDVVGKKKAKKNRVWGDAPPPSKLDFTQPRDEAVQGEPNVAVVVDQGLSLMDKDEEDEDDFQVDLEEYNFTAKGDDEKKVPTKMGWLSSLVQSVAGKAALEKVDLEPGLKVLRDQLMTKNVAADVAVKLCDSVAASLLGKKQGSFTRISSTVQAAMEGALLRILTPKCSVDILHDIHQAKEQGRPYVIVFVGVNGVGKSTNLAKVAYWLVQHDVSVMMAACDTFRSGAVEQLRTHARRLQIPIFDKGYEKDPAMVAKEAIHEALQSKQDVLLVDTAGRMQDNEPLMRALSKLINMNEPDMVLFVGEALVGNNGVDQLTKFNQKLADLSTTANLRLIDGILLTKFDTIDDKVGAALSMVYVSGVPVMFVGCGQTYTDLKKLNVKSLVKSLLV
ncbi:unnamed protein product [Sphagnum jensenii]|uniref:SRP54-type proteins GTP-binding domain-containing protein n=1 Tax=Sphagnum jensenii TaxID=128206 RepID=A0ABP1A6Y5_9BRYO